MLYSKLSSHSNHLSKPLFYIIPYHSFSKRFMWNRAKNQFSYAFNMPVTPRTRPITIIAGRIQAKSPAAPSEMPSIDQDLPVKVVSDQTGLHLEAIIGSCSSDKCTTTYCFGENAVECAARLNKLAIVTEKIGALTHKLPPDTPGTKLSDEDINGETKYGPQYIVKEYTTIPIDVKDYKEHPKGTSYLQQDHIAEQLVKHAPTNSPLRLEKEGKTAKKSPLKTPNDEETPN